MPVTVIKPLEPTITESGDLGLTLGTPAAPLQLHGGTISRQYVFPCPPLSLSRVLLLLSFVHVSGCVCVCVFWCPHAVCRPPSRTLALSRFVTVPKGAQWCDVTLTRVDGGSHDSTVLEKRDWDHSRLLVVHLVQV